MAQAKTIKGASEVRLSSEGGNPEINIAIDRDKMSALGIKYSGCRIDNADCI